MTTTTVATKSIKTAYDEGLPKRTYLANKDYKLTDVSTPRAKRQDCPYLLLYAIDNEHCKIDVSFFVKDTRDNQEMSLVLKPDGLIYLNRRFKKPLLIDGKSKPELHAFLESIRCDSKAYHEYQSNAASTVGTLAEAYQVDLYMETALNIID